VRSSGIYFTAQVFAEGINQEGKANGSVPVRRFAADNHLRMVILRAANQLISSCSLVSAFKKWRYRIIKGKWMASGYLP
jgi:hypothetical protein